MQNKTYSPKEIAAFRGLLQLAAGGRHFSNIKVQDIATAAGIGKGTLYEYFSSKEDILSCTMLYTLQQFADWIEQQMTREQSVYDMLDSLIDALEQEIFLPVSALPMFGSFLSHEQQVELGMRNREKAQETFERLHDYERQIFARGRQNGEIDPSLSDCFCEYTILSAFGGFASQFGKETGCCSDNPSNVCKNMVRQLIFRALCP